MNANCGIGMKRLWRAAIPFLVGGLLISCGSLPIPTPNPEPTIIPTPADYGEVTVNITNEELRNFENIVGTVEFLNDPALEKRLDRDRPWVKALLASAPEGARVAIFRVAHGEAWFWTMENNMQEEQAPRVRF